MENIVKWIEHKLSWFLSGKYWEWRCTLLCTMIVIFFSCPLLKDIHYQKQLFPGIYNCWGIFNLQKETPFNQQVFDSFHPSSHESKLAFRFTVPLLAKIFHLTSVQIYLMQVLMGLAQFIFIGLLVFKRFQDKTIALFFMVSYCFIYCGYMSFTQFGGIFDGVSIFFILLALYYQDVFFAIPIYLLAYFNDERSVLVSVTITCLFFFNSSKWFKSKPFLFSIASLVLYATIRLLLQYFLHLHTPSGENTGFNFDVLKQNFNGMSMLGKGFQLDFMLALEGFWILYLIFIYQNYNKGKILQLFAILLSIIPLALVAGMVYDTQRSIAYLFPSVIVLIYTIELEAVKMRKVMLCVLLCCFLIPTHPIALFHNTVGPANYLPYVLYDFFTYKP